MSKRVKKGTHDADTINFIMNNQQTSTALAPSLGEVLATSSELLRRGGLIGSKQGYTSCYGGVREAGEQVSVDNRQEDPTYG